MKDYTNPRYQIKSQQHNFNLRKVWYCADGRHPVIIGFLPMLAGTWKECINKLKELGW